MRSMSIIVEVFFLTALVTCLLGGMWLAIFDLGLKPKYGRAVMMALTAGGCAAVAFFYRSFDLLLPDDLIEVFLVFNDGSIFHRRIKKGSLDVS